MPKAKLFVSVSIVVLFSVSAFAVDGVVLINQASVMAAGGFPYRINSPGSYRLSGNLVVTGDTDAIDINADNISIDLNGFSITGPLTCTGSPSPSCTGGPAGTGIASSSSHEGITIKSGAITGFASGIRLDSAGGEISNTQANANQIGIVAGAVLTNNNSLFGGGFVITRCSANHNALVGIEANQSTVSNSTANSNGSIGIDSFESTLLGNTANANGEHGILAEDTLVGSNTALHNGSGDIGGSPASQMNNHCGGGLC